MGRTLKKPKRSREKEAALPSKFSPRFWEHCDSRLAIVRSIRTRYKNLYEACGGHESPQRDMLAQRIVFLSVMIETAEVEAAEEGRLDMGSYVQALNSFVGLMRTVGLDKRVKNVTELRTYLAEKERKAG